MKAIVRYQYGSPDVLKMEDVPKPVPSDDEVLIKIHAVSINGSDREALIGKPLYVRMGGLRKPGYPILGSDIAGRVAQALDVAAKLAADLRLKIDAIVGPHAA